MFFAKLRMFMCYAAKLIVCLWKLPPRLVFLLLSVKILFMKA